MIVTTRRHWLLLVAVVALGVAAYVAFILGAGAAEAHHGGGFYWGPWEQSSPWTWCRSLFNSAHQYVTQQCV